MYTGWTFAACDVNVAFKILELLAVAHPSDAINMIFELLYTSFYNVRVIRCKDSKLTRVHRKPDIQLSCKVTDWPEMFFAILSDIIFTPKVTPSRLSVYRQDITAKPNHS